MPIVDSQSPQPVLIANLLTIRFSGGVLWKRYRSFVLQRGTYTSVCVCICVCVCLCVNNCVHLCVCVCIRSATLNFFQEYDIANNRRVCFQVTVVV
jgi:hypothetical protein